MRGGIRVTQRGVYNLRTGCFAIFDFLSENDPEKIDAQLGKIKMILLEQLMDGLYPELDLKSLISMLSELERAVAMSRV